MIKKEETKQRCFLFSSFSRIYSWDFEKTKNSNSIYDEKKMTDESPQIGSLQNLTRNWIQFKPRLKNSKLEEIEVVMLFLSTCVSGKWSKLFSHERRWREWAEYNCGIPMVSDRREYVGRSVEISIYVRHQNFTIDFSFCFLFVGPRVTYRSRKLLIPF